MRELPRQLTVDELAELFEGRTALVELLAETDDPLGRADEVVARLDEAEKVEALVGASRRSGSARGFRRAPPPSRAPTLIRPSSPSSRT